MGWRCWELEARAAGLEANSQGTPSSQEARWLCALDELRQALGSGRHKPLVSCRLPQFAEGKAAWPCWVLSPRRTFLRLNTDPNQSSGQANPSLLHPSHTEQPLEKVCLTYSALPQCALRHALLPYELQRRASTMRERRHGALHPYGEGVPRGRSHPSCHAAEKQLPRHKVVCEEKRGQQVLAQG